MGYVGLSRTNQGFTELVQTRLPSGTLFARVQRLATEMVFYGYRVAAEPQAAAQLAAAEARSYAEAQQAIAQLRTMRPDMAAAIGDVDRALDRIHALSSAAIARRSAAGMGAAVRELDAARDIAVSSNKRNVAQATAQALALSREAERDGTAALVVAILATLGGFAAGWVVSCLGITRPLALIGHTMARLASGKTNTDVPGGDRRDEVGDMAKAVVVLRDAAIERERLVLEKERADAEQKMVVETLGQHMAALANGDLTAVIDRSFPADYAALRDHFNAALKSLAELIAAVADSANQIETGSTEISQAAEDLARRTEGNAASLEQTSAAISAMDGRLKATAKAATSTVARADQASATVSGGREIADGAVAAMERVSDSAKGIDSVIEGLDKIAFQTRVLAMNAAVEAGRAGEAGRGFAVVADLVSALAMRAEEEAKRARDQLTLTQTDIGTAVEAVQKVDGALAAISTDVSEVHKLLAAMANDNEAQASAITEISSAVASMDQATQQNAAMVEQTSAAARTLTTEVAAMTAKAGQFHTGRAPARRPQAAAVPAARAPRATAPAKRAAPAMAEGAGGEAEGWASF
ncbi:HAMP domain-containing protein [Sphingomonas changnyeongensis]|uniref:HAMP domain-containing protein n=2 Tax=Sphingomonas changnyeongensis TaxID=2698679 RepID=A0A7Z2S8Y5_9SPHN|nr:HAMP domain-containing protein [Sphingomonas changnyeongensis]